MAFVLVFPGQGSQSVGMLAEIAAAHSIVEETFASASDVLGYDLWTLIQDGPEEELNRTHNTQPALLTASVALWRVWMEQGGPSPVFLAGHSLGEYTALTCSEALRFEDAVGIVVQRGKLMQEAVPEGVGAVAAVLGLDDDTLREVCSQASGDEIVEAVNFNAPGQVVIAGHASAVERAISLASEAGAKRAIPLPVSVPSHCRLMKPAAEKLATRLEGIEIKTPRLPIVQNVDGRITSDPSEIKDKLCRQLHQPVLWVDTIRYMVGEGVTTVVECGPGKVLAGLCKRINREVSALPFFDTATLEKAIARCEEESE